MKLSEEQARRESKEDLESVGVHLPRVQWNSWEELMSDYDEEDRNLVEIAKKLEKRENPFEDNKQ